MKSSIPWKAVRDGWERVLFAAIGLACFAFSFRSIVRDDMSAAATTFAIGFFSFLYSNVSRFKRFKGLGFEAELWEDKQKEAETLIERLKGVVGVYTREIVMTRVMRGRLGGADSGWPDIWALYDEIVSKHDDLGQTLDFSDLKTRMDEIFIFDGVSRLSNTLGEQIHKAHSEIRKQIAEKYGSPIRDLEGHNRDHAALRSVSLKEDDLFKRSKSENIAQAVLDAAHRAQAAAKDLFQYSFELDETAVSELRFFAELYEKRPFSITPEIHKKAETLRG